MRFMEAVSRMVVASSCVGGQEVSVGTEFSLEGGKSSLRGWWCRPHDSVNLSVLNATELCTYKRKILCYIYFTTIKRKRFPELSL